MLIVSDFKGFEINNKLGSTEDILIYTEDDTQLKSCVGCFSCWIKTPGVCVMKDKTQVINQEALKHQQLVLITEITYGGYSSTVKKVFERMIPNILPYFKLVNHEVHHAPRYKHYPELIVIGYGQNITEGEKTTFKKLVKANAINMQCKKHQCFIVEDKEGINKLVTQLGGECDE